MGRAATVEKPVVAALSENGFVKDSDQDYWSSRGDGQFRSLMFRVVEPGEPVFLPGQGRRLRAKGEGVLFSLTVAA